MARRPFEPGELGWSKTEYRQGDILDREAVGELVAEADAVVHLAFIVVRASEGSYDINIEGSRNVFEAKVAAYGYHDDVDGRLTEDEPARGTDKHAYSHQKAEVERVLAEAVDGSDVRTYVFRPCVVAGPDATALIDQLPYVRFEHVIPAPVRAVAGRVPGVRPVLPDHGVPIQLVHHDDVAEAMVAATLGKGEPG